MQIVTSKGTKKLHLWLDTVSTLLFSPNINAKIKDPSNKATRHEVTNNVCSYSIEVTKGEQLFRKFEPWNCYFRFSSTTKATFNRFWSLVHLIVGHEIGFTNFHGSLV